MTHGLLAAAAVAATAVVSWCLLAAQLEISAARGDWRRITSGLRPSVSGRLLVGHGRALVHLHDLGGAPASVELVLSRRGRAILVPLTITRDGALVVTLALSEAPISVAIEVPRGQDAVEILLSESVAGAPDLPTFTVHAVRFTARERWPLALMPPLVAALVLALLRIHGLPVASAWAALCGLTAAWATAAALAPVHLLALDAPAWLMGRLAVLAALWALVGIDGPIRLRTAVVSCATTVMLLLGPTLGYGFVTDDFFFARPLSAEQLISTLTGSWDPVNAANQHYRPVTAATFAFDYAVWGAFPPGFHLTNLMLHAACGVTAFTLLRRLDLPPAGSLLGGLAWIAHPLSASAAAWANERTDGVMALFYLASLAMLVGRPFDLRRAAAAMILASLALGAKEMAVTLPLTAALLLLALGGSRRQWLTAGGIALLVVGYMLAWRRMFPGKTSTTLAMLAEGSGYARPLGLAAEAVALVFVPRPYAAEALPWLGHLAAGLLLPVVIAGALWARRAATSARVALSGLAWCVFTVMPLAALKGGVDLYRLGLLIALGFALGLAAATALADRQPRAVAILAAALALWLAPQAIATAAAWGPGGMNMQAGTRWKLGNEAWYASISPEMKALFLRQAAEHEHLRHP